MGLIDRGREAADQADAEHYRAMSDARTQAIESSMAEVAHLLTEPTYTGDIDTVLIHHMGRSAFHEADTTDRYVDLARRIEANSSEDPTPVLIVHHYLDELGTPLGSDSALIKVASGVMFRSTVEQEDNVIMHAWTGATASVTHRKLELVGPVTHIHGDITRTEFVHFEPAHTGDFVLSSSDEALNYHTTGIPSSHSFNGGSTDRLENDPTILVGWSEIEQAIAKGLSKTGGVKEVLALKDVFAASGDLDDLASHAPKLADVITRADALQQSLGNLAGS